MKFLTFILFCLGLNYSGKTQEKSFFFIDVVNKSSYKVLYRFKDSMGSLSHTGQTKFSVPLDKNNDLPSYFYIAIADSNNRIKQQKQFRILPDKVESRKVMVTIDGQISSNLGNNENIIELYQNKLTKNNFWELTKKVVEQNFNSSAGAEIVYLTLCESSHSIDTIRHFYNLLSNVAKKTTSGKNIQKYLQGRENFKVGTLVKDFELPNHQDKLIKLSDIKSEFILIDFWFSTCIPCIESFPDLKDFYKTSNRNKFEVLGLSVDAAQRKQKWKSVIEQEKLPWINLLDSNFDISYHQFSIQFYPTTILIGRDRKIIKINPNLNELKDITKINHFDR